MRKINIGSGSHPEPDYLNCDIVQMPGVDFVCPADKFPFDSGTASEILSEHMIEHLTFEEFNRAIVEWFRVLGPGGSLVIECPDLLGVCQAFVESNEYNRYKSFKGYWPLIAHLYGHQRGSSQEEKFSQIHKSGYTREYLIYCLRGVGFTSFVDEPARKANPDSPTLRIRATK